MSISQEFNYKEALNTLNEIKDFFDTPQFKSTFDKKSDEVKQIVYKTIEMIENKEKPSLIKRSLNGLKELVIGVSGSLIASGILALLANLPS